MPRRPSRTPGHAQQSNNSAFHKEDGCRTALINGMQFARADDAPPQLRPDAAEMLMIHQKMIDSEDLPPSSQFLQPQVLPTNRTGTVPTLEELYYRNFPHFCTTETRRAQCQNPHSIDWAHFSYTCTGACRTLRRSVVQSYV
jgi:hypothetical protein